MIDNKSVLSKNEMNLTHKFMKKDNQASGLFHAYGAMIFTVDSYVKSMTLSFENSVKYAIAEGSFWGSCIKTGFFQVSATINI